MGTVILQKNVSPPSFFFTQDTHREQTDPWHCGGRLDGTALRCFGRGWAHQSSGIHNLTVVWNLKQSCNKALFPRVVVLGGVLVPLDSHAFFLLHGILSRCENGCEMQSWQCNVCLDVFQKKAPRTSHWETIIIGLLRGGGSKGRGFPNLP